MKQLMKQSTTQLGHNYVYHFNEFESKWYCIHRDSYLNYWSKTLKVGSNNWTSGKTIEVAADRMVILQIV